MAIPEQRALQPYPFVRKLRSMSPLTFANLVQLVAACAAMGSAYFANKAANVASESLANEQAYAMFLSCRYDIRKNAKDFVPVLVVSELINGTDNLGPALKGRKVHVGYDSSDFGIACTLLNSSRLAAINTIIVFRAEIGKKILNLIVPSSPLANVGWNIAPGDRQRFFLSNPIFKQVILNVVPTVQITGPSSQKPQCYPLYVDQGAVEPLLLSENNYGLPFNESAVFEWQNQLAQCPVQ